MVSALHFGATKLAIVRRLLPPIWHRRVQPQIWSLVALRTLSQFALIGQWGPDDFRAYMKAVSDSTELFEKGETDLRNGVHAMPGRFLWNATELNSEPFISTVYCHRGSECACPS